MATKDITDVQVCEAVRDTWDQAGHHIARPHELLSARTGQPEKVCWRALERAAGRGLIDYGIGLQGAWLTDQGKALLSSNAADKPTGAACRDRSA